MTSIISHKTNLTKLILFLTFLPICLSAQVYYQSHFDKSLQAEEDAKRVLSKLQDKSLAAVLLKESEDLPKKAQANGLLCNVSLQIKNGKGTTVYQSPAEKARLFPGDLFYPKKTFFPGDLFQTLESGCYQLNFKIVALDPEMNELLKSDSKGLRLCVESINKNKKNLTKSNSL
ncbi:MAG: hypothetical protein VW080_09460 [Flavobacteriaceae bacterium]